MRSRGWHSGCGITNLVARTTARADELTRDELRAGRRRLERTGRRYRPGCVASGWRRIRAASTPTTSSWISSGSSARCGERPGATRAQTQLLGASAEPLAGVPGQDLLAANRQLRLASQRLSRERHRSIALHLQRWTLDVVRCRRALDLVVADLAARVGIGRIVLPSCSPARVRT